MKRVLTSIWIVLIIFFVCLLVNYVANEMMISDYEKGEYNENSLSVLGFTEPYISHYNKGNVLYQSGNYEEAIKEYEEALKLNPPHDRECLIRINIALAMTMPIDVEEISESNIDDVITTLEEAKNVLIEHGCANRDDDNGHNMEAQTLKNDIDKFLEELKNSSGSGNEDPSGGDDGDDDGEDGDDEVEEKEKKKEQLQELQKQGIIDRNSELENIDNLFEFEFYSGPTW